MVMFDATSLFTMSQRSQETAQDFITRVTRCAKHIPTLHDTMIQYAIFLKFGRMFFRLMHNR